MAIFEDSFDGPADVLLSDRPGWTAYGPYKFLFTNGTGAIKGTDTVGYDPAIFACDTGSQNHFVEVTVGKAIEDFGGELGFVKGGMGQANGTYPHKEAYSLRFSKGGSKVYLQSQAGNVADVTAVPKAGDVVRIEAQMAPDGLSLTVRFFINGALKGNWPGLPHNLTRTGAGILCKTGAPVDDIFRHVRGGEADFDTISPTLTGQITVVANTYNSLTLQCPVGADNVGVTGYRWSRDSGATWIAGTRDQVFSGLTASTEYQIRASALDAPGNPSVPLALAVTTAAAPANLSALTAVSESSSLITASVTAQAAGKAWAMATTSATPPTAAAVKAGTSGAAPGVVANLVAGVNPGCFSLSGLQPSTSYWVHTTSELDANNLSPVLTSAVVATRHLGVLGRVILAQTGSGAHGPGLLYALASGKPNVYFHLLVTSWPAGGFLDWNPNGSFEYAGPAGNIAFTVSEDGGAATSYSSAVAYLGTPDTTIPTLTGVITIVARTHNSVSLQCPIGSDNVGVSSYEWSKDAGTTWVQGTRDQTFSGLTPEATYAFRARAKDAAGNVSTPALALAVTTDPAPAAVRRCSVVLTTDGTTPAANLSGIHWAWWDSAAPTFGAAPLLFGAGASTNAAGLLEVNLPTSTLAVGGIGTLLAVISDGTPAGAANRALCKPVAVI